MSNSIPIYNITDIEDLQGLQLVVTNKNSSGTEAPNVQNGSILNYVWKRNNTIIKSGSSNSFRYYSPTQLDLNKTLSCEVTAFSSYDSTIVVKKISYIKIVLDFTDIIPETDIVENTDIVIETDIIPETDIVENTDIVIETDIVPDTDIDENTDVIIDNTDILVLFLNDVSLRRSDYPNSIGITIVNFDTDSIDLFVSDANNQNSLIPITNFPLDSLSYQWKRNGIVIPGETNQFYSLQLIDLNTSISCSVIANFEGNIIQKNTQSVYIGTFVNEEGWTTLTPTQNSRLIYIGDPNNPNDGNDSQAANNQYNRSYYTINDPIIGSDPTNPINPSAIKSYKTITEARKAFRNHSDEIFDPNTPTIPGTAYNHPFLKGYPDWYLFKRGCDYRKHYLSDPTGYGSELNDNNSLNTINITITNYYDTLNFFNINNIITKESAIGVQENQQFRFKIIGLGRGGGNGEHLVINGQLLNHGKIDNMFTGNLVNITTNQTFNLPQNSQISYRYGSTYPILSINRSHPIYGRGIWGESESAPAVITAWGSESSLDRPKFNKLLVDSHSNYVKVVSFSVENDIVPDELYEVGNTSNIQFSTRLTDGAADISGVTTTIYYNNKIFIGGKFLGFDFRSNLINCNHVAVYDPSTDTLSKTNDDNLRFTNITKFIIFNGELYATGSQYVGYTGCLLKYNNLTNSWQYILGHPSFLNGQIGKDLTWYVSDAHVYNNKMYLLALTGCSGYSLCQLIQSNDGINFTKVNLPSNYIESSKMEFHQNYCYFVNNSRYLYRLDLNTNNFSKVTQDEIYYFEKIDDPNTTDNEEEKLVNIHSIKIIGNDLYLLGKFDIIGNTSGYNNFAKLNLNTLEWSSMNFPSSNCIPVHLEVGFNNNFYIALTGSTFTINSNNKIRSYIKYNVQTNSYESITEPSSNCDDNLGFSSGDQANATRVVTHNRILKYTHNGVEKLFVYNNIGLYNIENDDKFYRIVGSYHHSNLKGVLIEDIYCKGNLLFNGKNDDLRIRRCVFSGSFLTNHSQNVFVTGNDTSENTLFEECLFDMGGMSNNIYNSNYWVQSDKAVQKYVPRMTVFTRNMYAVSFVNVRGCVFSRPSSGNFQLRNGGCVERNLFIFSDSVCGLGHPQTNPLSRSSAIIKSNVMMYENPLSHTGGYGTFISVTVPKKGIAVVEDNIRTYSLCAGNGGVNFGVQGYSIYSDSNCGITNLTIPTEVGEYALILDNVVWTPLMGAQTFSLRYHDGANINDSIYDDKSKHVENIIIGKNKILNSISTVYCQMSWLGALYNLYYWNKTQHPNNPTNSDTQINFNNPSELILPENWKIGHTSDFKNYYCAINAILNTNHSQDNYNSLLTFSSSDKILATRSAANTLNQNETFQTLGSFNFNLSDWKTKQFDNHSEYYSNIQTFMTNTGITDPGRDLVTYFTDPNSPGYDAEYSNLYNLNSNDPNYPENVEFDEYAIIKRSTDRKKYWEVVNEYISTEREFAGFTQTGCSNFGGSDQLRSSNVEYRAKQIARKFHAFLHLIKKMKQNRKGAWDSRYTANSINDYIREGFGKQKFENQGYDTRRPSTRFQEYIDNYFD